MVFVCSDPKDYRGICAFAAITTAAFSEVGIHFGGYEVLDGTNAHRAFGMISHCDFIVLSGGHVPTQNAFFRKIRLRHLLKAFKGTVMGISAGSMNMAGSVYLQPEESGESVPEFRRFAPGLGLTWVNILPHYQKAKDYMIDGKRLYEEVTFADSMDHQFFALPDNSYFYQDEDGLLLCGQGYRLKDGIMELLCVEDDILNMEVLT